jgi:hypothetical protein
LLFLKKNTFLHHIKLGQSLKKRKYDAGRAFKT